MQQRENDREELRLANSRDAAKLALWDEMREACKALAEYDSGTNICGESLCPICSNPMTGNEGAISHGDKCPFPAIRDVLAKIDAIEQIGK